MIETQFIISFSMAVTNVIKRHVAAEYVPFITILLSVILNVLNAVLFNSELLTAAKDAFISSGIFVGLFVVGDSVRKSDKTKFKNERENPTL